MKPSGETSSGGHSIWVFSEEMTIWWFERTRKYTMHIPKDFRTDFASTPRWIWWWLPPFNSEYTPACLPHDLGYERNGTLVLMVEDDTIDLRKPLDTQWSRLALDQLMLAGMKSRGVSLFKRQSIYRSVRVGGLSAWRGHKKKNKIHKHQRRFELNYPHGIRD